MVKVPFMLPDGMLVCQTHSVNAVVLSLQGVMLLHTFAYTTTGFCCMANNHLEIVDVQLLWPLVKPRIAQTGQLFNQELV